MPLLLVPPTQIVPFDAERTVEHKKAIDEFRSRLVSLWQPKLSEEIKNGTFRGGRLYEWNEPFDALLQTYFIFPSTSRERVGEVARIAAVFKKENCQLLGSVIVWGSEWIQSLPSGLGKQNIETLKEAPQRRFDELRSPVRLTLEGRGFWATTLAWISEAFLGEKFAREGLVVHSDLSGVACGRLLSEKKSFLESKNMIESVASQGPGVGSSSEQKSKTTLDSRLDWKKGHRQVKVILDGQVPRAPLRWPVTQGKLTITSLPLNETQKGVQQEPLPQAPFLPSEMSDKIHQRLIPFLHKMNQKEIRIVKRDGRFVTVERGLAYGLRIGMHLVGPDGAKLHVIRFDNENGHEDAAILLIRQDSKIKPLAEGAMLQIDQTIFPEK